MAISREERAAINRANARKSTGPKSAEGKARSSRNALRHGLRIEKIDLPEEEARRAEDLARAWRDYYQPVTSDENALVDACVAAVLLWERCERFYQQTITRQAAEAIQVWEREQDEAVAELVRMLEVEPATAISGLGRSSAGCRYLMGRWEALHAALELQRWDASLEQEAKRLAGLPPHARLDPARIGPVVAGCLMMLAEQAERLETTVEAEERSKRVKVASILLDTGSCLYLRTARRARCQFDRNYRHLLQMLADRLTPNEATAAAEATGAIEAIARAEASFPNEAKATQEAKGSNEASSPRAKFPIEPNGNLGGWGRAKRAPGELTADRGLEARPQPSITNEAKASTDAEGANEPTIPAEASFAIEPNGNLGGWGRAERAPGEIAADRGLETRPQPPCTTEASAPTVAKGANEANDRGESLIPNEANPLSNSWGWTRVRAAARVGGTTRRWWLRRRSRA